MKKTLPIVGGIVDFASQVFQGEDAGHALIKAGAHALIGAGVAALVPTVGGSALLGAVFGAVLAGAAVSVADLVYDNF